MAAQIRNVLQSRLLSGDNMAKTRFGSVATAGAATILLGASYASAATAQSPTNSHPIAMDGAGGFHSYKMSCSSNYAKASTYRRKGSGNCNSGEIAEWGIWCTSDFAHMTANQIRRRRTRLERHLYGHQWTKAKTESRQRL